MKRLLKKTHPRTLYFLIVIITFLCSCTQQNHTKCFSPDNNVEIILDSEGSLQYAVIFNQDMIINHSNIEIILTGEDTLKYFEILEITGNSANENWERVWGKRKTVTNNYNEIKLHTRNPETGILVDVYARVYNDGVAFRYGFPEQDGLTDFEIAKENTRFTFTKNHKIWAADYKTYVSSQEQEFLEKKLSDIKPSQLIGMPLLIELEDKGYAVITEANLTDWSGAFLKSDGASENSVVTQLAHLPNDSLVAVKRNTPAVSPWRVIMLANEPGGLIESDLIANLNDPLALDDASWIEPGVSAWDWWWCNKYAPSVGFELGPNQETMKYFIDFASKMGWEYQIVDWQWYGEPFEGDGPNPNADITTCIDGIDIKELVKYANSKNVKLVIWLHWWHLNRQMDEALALYEDWGVSGIKIDFMDRQDQEMVNYYHTVAKKAAEHKLVVDFHGAYKPTGVSRTYPNLITREGVMGNEYTKWSNRITPEHNVTLPFTRGLLGEMDYTPVAFRNVTSENFVTEEKTEDGSPVVQSTRCQQLAMPVVYESAFGVFCDSPDNYSKGIGQEFLKLVPTTWDETKVLNASVGNYITIARKSGDNWFIGSMTDADERELTVDLTFLGDGEYRATSWQDADDANVNPSNVVKNEITVTNKDILKIKMAKGGGFAAVLEEI